MCRNANVSRLVTSTGRGGETREAEREDREEGYTGERELSWISESGIRDNPNEHDNSVCRLVSSFCERCHGFSSPPLPPSPPPPPSFPRLHSNGTGDARSPDENGFAPARTIRSYVSVAAAYMHLLKETRCTRTRRAERIELSLSLLATSLSSRFSPQSISNTKSEP